MLNRFIALPKGLLFIAILNTLFGIYVTVSAFAPEADVMEDLLAGTYITLLGTGLLFCNKIARLLCLLESWVGAIMLSLFLLLWFLTGYQIHTLPQEYSQNVIEAMREIENLFIFGFSIFFVILTLFIFQIYVLQSGKVRALFTKE